MTRRVWFLVMIVVGCVGSTVFACTNILVSKGASKDGSVMITYSCDGEFHPHMRISPAIDHKDGEVIPIRG